MSRGVGQDNNFTDYIEWLLPHFELLQLLACLAYEPINNLFTTKIFELLKKYVFCVLQFLVCYPYPQEWGEGYPRAIVLMRFLVYYSLPLAVIALFYVLMARHLVLSTQNMPGEMQGTQRQVIKFIFTIMVFSDN